MSILLAVDPGIRGTGCALFSGQTLIAAAYVVNPLASGNQAGEAAAMAAAVCKWAPDVDELAVEWPRVYATQIRAGRSKGDPNDLLGLAAVDAAIAAHLDAFASVTSYVPSEWKGQLPKDVMSARVHSRLSSAESALVLAVKPASKRHNVWDAVGVGLYHLGRLGVRRAP